MGNPAVSRANHLYLTYHLCPRNYQSYTVPISICLCGHVGLWVGIPEIAALQSSVEVFIHILYIHIIVYIHKVDIINIYIYIQSPPLSLLSSLFSLLASRFSLLASRFSLLASLFSLLSSLFSLLSSRFSLLASRFSLLASRFSLLASRFSLLASRFSLLASRFSLLASRFSLLASRFSLLASPFSLLPSRFSLLASPFSLLPSPFSLLPSPFSLLPSPFSFSLLPSPLSRLASRVSRLASRFSLLASRFSLLASPSLPLLPLSPHHHPIRYMICTLSLMMNSWIPHLPNGQGSAIPIPPSLTGHAADGEGEGENGQKDHAEAQQHLRQEPAVAVEMLRWQHLYRLATSSS